MISISSTFTIPKFLLGDYLDTLRADLTFPNPFNFEEVALGYQEDEEFIKVPRGLPLNNYGISLNTFIDDTINSESDFSTTEGFSLRDYQEVAEREILELLEDSKVYNKNILLTAPTGSGKTVLLASVLAKLKQRVLFLSHLSMLSEQVLKELSENTTASVGILTGKTEELFDINIATFQLLNVNQGLLSKIADTVSVVVVDETENVASPTRLAVLFSLKAKTHIYVSATPSRELVKRTGIIEALVTHKVSMSPSSQVDLKYLMLDYRHLSWQSPDNQMFYKSSLFSFLKTSKILDDTVSLVESLSDYQGTIWIIASLDKIHKYLTDKLESKGIICKSIQGLTGKRERSKILDEISNGKLKVIISSAPMSAGISIPELSAAIRLEPHSSSDEVLEQQIGRLKRYTKFKDTQSPLWVDFAISGSLEYKGKQRFKLYQQRGGCDILHKDKLNDYFKRPMVYT